MPAASIVVGMDFSEGSRRALQAVTFLARGTGARIRLVHAYPKGHLKLAGVARRQVEAGLGVAEVDEALQLTALAEDLRKKGIQAETAAVEGKAAAVLLAQAKKAKAGLVAVGTAGRRGVRELFLGSVSQAVLRDSPVPVLVTPARHRQGSKRAGPVLAAVDLGPGSGAVLAAAAGLAADLGVAVHAFHVVPLPFVGGTFPEGELMFTPEMLVADEEEAALRLSQLVERLRTSTKVQVSVGLGDAATHALAQAQHLGAAAIVVGRRQAGRRLGSVSSALVHAADRPVVIVPAAGGRAKPSR